MVYSFSYYGRGTIPPSPLCTRGAFSRVPRPLGFRGEGSEIPWRRKPTTLLRPRPWSSLAASRLLRMTEKAAASRACHRQKKRATTRVGAVAQPRRLYLRGDRRRLRGTSSRGFRRARSLTCRYSRQARAAVTAKKREQPQGLLSFFVKER